MEEKKEVLYIPVDDILPNRFQPRLTFDEKELANLSNSIIKYGVIQPIVVRKMGDKFEIVAGERRYKASVLAGLKKIPALLIDSDDNNSAEIALLENLQRKNLTSIEEAQSFKKLLDKGFTQEDIASKLGVSQPSVANKIRLLNLPQEVQDALLYNRISERHARSLLTLNNRDLQVNLLNRIISEKLTVRQTEEEINLILNKENIMNEQPAVDLKDFLSQNEQDASLATDNEAQNIKEDAIDEILSFDAPEVINIDEPGEYKEENDVVNPFNAPTNVINLDEVEIEKGDTSASSEISEQIEADEDNNEIPTLEPLNNQEINEKESFIPESNPLPVEEEKPEKNMPYFPPSIDEEEIEEETEETDNNAEDLPYIINKVRDFVRSIDNTSVNIATEEVDLPDVYRITINIQK